MDLKMDHRSVFVVDLVLEVKDQTEPTSPPSSRPDKEYRGKGTHPFVLKSCRGTGPRL